MRNARGGQQEAAMSGSDSNSKEFLHKKMCNQEVSRFSREKRAL